MSMTVLGATNEDHTFTLKSPLRLKDSNPVRDEKTLGGVGFNMARTLEIAGADILFLTAFDEPLKAYFKKIIIEKAEKPSYYAVIDNDMEVAFAAMDGLKALKGDVFMNALKTLKEDDILLSDLNFETSLLKTLFENTRAHIYVEATSAHKVFKVKTLIAYLYGLKLNELEAKILTEKEDLEEAIRELETWPIKEIVITCGACGAYIIDNHVTHFQDQAPFESIHMSGVGDAFMAGFMMEYDSALDRIKNAMTMALLTSQVESSTMPDLDLIKFKKTKEKRYVRILTTRPRST